MAALAANRDTEQIGSFTLVEMPVKASTHIYKGALVSVDSTGYLIPAADTASTVVVGVAYEEGDNSSGSNGDVTVRVMRGGIYRYDATSITQAMIGATMYVKDDHTFDDSSSNSIACGKLVKYISATEGWIDITSAM